LGIEKGRGRIAEEERKVKGRRRENKGKEKKGKREGEVRNVIQL